VCTENLRLTAQLVLLDPADRILLFRREDDEGVGFWGPVGGGIESGESAEEAVLREAREETGLDVALGPEIWHRQHAFSWRGEPQIVQERWFLGRAPTAEISTAGWSPNEIRTITDHAWRTLTEVRHATERTVPRNLADLLAELLSAGPPDRPIAISI
jgi:ADP-ribose pyrophosphatase YjhB (NUDIX family)